MSHLLWRKCHNFKTVFYSVFCKRDKNIFFSEVEKFERKTFLKRDYISYLDCDGEIDTSKYATSNSFWCVKWSFEIKIVCRASRPWGFMSIVFARAFLGSSGLSLNSGGSGSISVWRVKISHASWPKNQNTKQKQYCNQCNKTLKNGAHQEVSYSYNISAFQQSIYKVTHFSCHSSYCHFLVSLSLDFF